MRQAEFANPINGQPIAIDTLLEVPQNGRNDMLFVPATLRNSGTSAQEFLLFQPGFLQYWQEEQNKHHRREAYLFGIDLNGSAVYYMTMWGEVLSCCTVDGFFAKFAESQAQAEQNPLWKTHQRLWRRVRQFYAQLFPDIDYCIHEYNRPCLS